MNDGAHAPDWQEQRLSRIYQQLSGDRWYDDEAGPVVRPYAMTRGRTRSATDSLFDLVSLVQAVNRPVRAEAMLSPEHHQLLEHSYRPLAVADLSASTKLPLGVIRVLLGDLYSERLIHVTRPVPPAQPPDEDILREVLNGLRAL